MPAGTFSEEERYLCPKKQRRKYSHKPHLHSALRTAQQLQEMEGGPLESVFQLPTYNPGEVTGDGKDGK